MKLKKWFFGILALMLITSIPYTLCEAADNTPNDVTNYSPQINTDLWILSFFSSGTSTVTALGSQTTIASFVVPSKYRLITVKARAEGFDNGTASNRCIIDVQEALRGTTTSATMLTSTISIGTASSSVVGTPTDTVMDDESLIKILQHGSGTSNLTVEMYVERTQ